jgi:hypothetical protein
MSADWRTSESVMRRSQFRSEAFGEGIVDVGEALGDGFVDLGEALLRRAVAVGETRVELPIRLPIRLGEAR